MFNVLDPDADVSDMVYVATRTSEGPPHVPSTDKFTCTSCSANVWVDKRSAMQAVRCRKILCTQCAAKDIEKEIEQEMKNADAV